MLSAGEKVVKTLSLLPGCSDHDHADWLIGPVGQHRDSDSIEESNFRVAVARFQAIDPDEHDHEIHRFGHWAVGWVEEIATRPGSPCAALAVEMRAALADYAILDEDDHSALESEHVTENMSAIMSELRSDLRKEFARRNALDPEFDDMSEDEISDALDEIEDEKLLDVADEHTTGERDGWQYFNVREVADSLLAKGLL